MKRICIVGTTGAGKSTMARRLAVRLGSPHLELDSYYWGPDWTPRAKSRFRTDVATATASERWVADGNYHAVRDIVWGRADTLVWLDYSIGRILQQLLWRTGRRVATREELWNGNRERLYIHLATRQSLFLWALQTHWRRRRRYQELVERRDFPHLEVKRFYSPRESEKWLTSLQGASVSRLFDRTS